MATKVKLVADGVVTADQLTLTTASTGTNTTAPATTAFVQQEVAALVDSSPDALNTLNELAAALGDDANFSTTVTNSIATKAPLASPDFTGQLQATNSATTTHELIVTGNNTRSAISMQSKDSSGNAVDLRMHSLGDGPRAEIFTFTNHDLAFATNNASPQLTLKTNGNVGIGETSPLGKLHVKTADSGGSVNANGNQLVIENSGSAGLSILSGTTGDGNIFLGDSGNNVAGVLQYSHNGDSFRISSTGQLLLQTGGANTRLTIDSSGNVGIGTSSPSSYQANGDDLVVATSGHTGITIASGTSHLGNIHFADGTTGDDAYRGFIQYEHTANYMRFATNAAEAMRIDSSGNVGIGTNNPTFTATSFKGIEVEVSGDLFPNVRLERVSGSSKTNQAYEMVIGTGGNWHVRNATTTSAPLSIATDDTIHMIGNVGIGTSSPANYGSGSQGLTINGTGNYQNLNLQVGGTTQFTMYTNGVSGTFLNQVTADPMMFYTSDTERMRIDASGNVGIGTSSISATDWGSSSKILQIAGTQPLLSLKDTDVTDGEFQIANSGQNLYIYDAAASATRMRIHASGCIDLGANVDRSLGTNITTTVTSGSAGSGFWLSTGNSSATSSKIFTTVNGSVGELFINQGSGVNGGSTIFEINDTQQFRVNSNGTVVVRTGILFGSDSAAANQLDDYEEGTFDASITPGSGSYTLNAGYSKLGYTKIGRIVTITGQIVISGSSGASGAVTIGDLPFEMLNDTQRSSQTRPSIHIYANGSGAPASGYYSAFIAFNEGNRSGSLIVTYNSTFDSTPGDWLTGGSDFFINFAYHAA